ncbi:MAG: hypothetical protein WEB09_03090 [Nitriliruptor sp.]
MTTPRIKKLRAAVAAAVIATSLVATSVPAAAAPPERTQKVQTADTSVEFLGFSWV